MPINFITLKKYVDESSIFIETGSCIGNTISLAVKIGVKEVHSIELAKHHYNTCVRKFERFSNVHLYYGASEYELPKILKNIDSKCVFWLDGHYSDGDTALGETSCPLYLELDAIANHHIKDHVILIDDIRLFGNVWKHIDINEIKRKLKSINNKYNFMYENGSLLSGRYFINDILIALI